ncbi:hypothetical protein [Deinococcus sp. PEB2-63]
MGYLQLHRIGADPSDHNLDANDGKFDLKGISQKTVQRSRDNILKAKAAHARLHAAFMEAPKPEQPVQIPAHLLAAFQ